MQAVFLRPTFRFERGAMFNWVNLLAISVGASAGAVLRWWLGAWLNNPHWLLPWGTLAANFLGAWLIGVLLGVLSWFPELPSWLRLMLMTGFLGGLTTFSTFSAETFGLLERGQTGLAFGYMGLSVSGSIGLTTLGFMVVQGVPKG